MTTLRDKVVALVPYSDQKLALAVARAVTEHCASVCEQNIVNRPDDPPANYFDGGLRTCAAAIRKEAEGLK